MFELRYLSAELRRRRGRTALTALGLGVGVGLVIAVTALGRGLDDAQQDVLEPLTGVGTDMSVSRPISITSPAGGGFPQISPEERAQLEKENADIQLDVEDLGDPGDRFSIQRFFSREISFKQRQAARIGRIDGVAGVAPSLSLELIHFSGTVPKPGELGGLGGPPPESAQGGEGGSIGGFSFEPTSVTGIDTSQPDLGPLTSSEIVDGGPIGSAREAVVNASYAADQGIEVGDRINAAGHRLEVVGIARRPIGGEAADVYVDLGALQKASDREGRVNELSVRATDVSEVPAVRDAIERDLKGSEVTTAEQLGDRVSGSLLDAQQLSSSLGTALAIVSLLAAFLIAVLLTLSAVSKRTREIGTLKALGWRRAKVVRQIGGESLAQGLLGGVAGVAIGVGAAALIDALGISLKATAAVPGGGNVFDQFLGSRIATGATDVTLSAPLDPGLLLAAVGLAILGGLVAGIAGGLRAARMRPSDALRSVE